jgi:hypothetical protein
MITPAAAVVEVARVKVMGHDSDPSATRVNTALPSALAGDTCVKPGADHVDEMLLAQQSATSKSPLVTPLG